MRYDKVVKLYKNYSLSTGTKRYLVGYFRSDGSASAEESYLRRAEKEPVPVSYTTEVEPATLYPDIVKFSAMLKEKGVKNSLYVGEGLNHVFPAFPIPEADLAIREIVRLIEEV